MLRNTLIFLWIAALTVACTTDDAGSGTSDGDQNPDPTGFDRSAMLEHWADAIIIPGYTAWQAEVTDLQSSVAAFAADPTTSNLADLRTQWITAYTVWQRVAMFELGPAESNDLRLSVNTYPTNAGQIESHIASGSYDLSLPSNRTAKGFPAMDYLLNGIAATDAAIVAIYTGAEGTAYLQYLTDVVADMDRLSETVLDSWQASYRDTFVANDGASATASTDRLVNDYIFYYEKFLRAGKMGIPLGVFSGSPEPQTLEAFYYPSLGKTLFLEGLNAVQDFFNGKAFDSASTGPSLASYLDALNTVKEGSDLSQIINQQFNTARSAVTTLGHFKTEIEENNPPTAMLNAYDEVQRMVPLLKVDMVSAMSISIDYVDADGD